MKSKIITNRINMVCHHYNIPYGQNGVYSFILNFKKKTQRLFEVTENKLEHGATAYGQ